MIVTSSWLVRQLELFTPLSHDFLVFGTSLATWWYTLPLAFLVLPSLFLAGELLWFAMIFSVIWGYREQTLALQKMFENDQKRTGCAQSARNDRFLFRLLPLVNFFMFTFAALALYGNRDTQSEFDRFVILAVASFIVLLYELLACVEPIKKYRGPKIP